MRMCEQHKDSLAALMVMPSSRAFSQDNKQQICQIVHDNGGQGHEGFEKAFV